MTRKFRGFRKSLGQEKARVKLYKSGKEWVKAGIKEIQLLKAMGLPFLSRDIVKNEDGEVTTRFGEKIKKHAMQTTAIAGGMFTVNMLHDQQAFAASDAPMTSELATKSQTIGDQTSIAIENSVSHGEAQAMMQNSGDSKLGVVVHAEHFSENATDEHHILWNNYYEYQFTNHKEVDFYITATERQKDILAKQFKKYLNAMPKIFTIPVGCLDQLRKPNKKRKPYSIITASRLASEKHIDWLVRAAVIAKKEVPKLTFDIYGEGGERVQIQDLIQSHQAEDYIRLLGHVKLDDVYADYKLFAAASTSEGFGLTLMEAVGSGLGMIGFDVNYGNPTFIRDGKNGYLIPIDVKEEGNEAIIQRLADAMVQYFNHGPKKPHDTSYRIARPYLLENIQQNWKDLVEEVQHG
ncbi:glycosyltransferase [Staphylococcus schleiferi subsp. coagulans]|uniref:glycosyltransferase n=1 Tax=Staphylococcus coagulans TaxID=74706 RepID=UPI0015FA6F0A|nr:glycosyltransferase [Staphylococcus coagulans]MBA8760727.1 glycosyltransferase [Staphylococcus coagulans]MBA8769460.1 glycosyltransferase [Staphylococcus coagulans]